MTSPHRPYSHTSSCCFSGLPHADLTFFTRINTHMRFPNSPKSGKNDYSYKLELLFNKKMSLCILRGSNTEAASPFFTLIHDLRAHDKSWAGWGQLLGCFELSLGVSSHSAYFLLISKTCSFCIKNIGTNLQPRLLQKHLTISPIQVYYPFIHPPKQNRFIFLVFSVGHC